MDTFGLVDIFNEMANLAIGRSEVRVVVQVYLFFLDGANHALGIGILRGLPLGRRARPSLHRSQAVHISSGSILDTLVRVVNFRVPLTQRLLQCRQRQGATQSAAQMPTPQAAGIHVQQDRQVDVLGGGCR